MSEISIVTAYFDIGREKWGGYSRNKAQYLNYFKFWARIKNKIVVYTDDSVAKEVLKIRKEFLLEDKTEVVIINDIKSLDNIIFHKLKEVFESKDIVNYRKFPKRPESYNMNYNYITYLKPYFVADAIKKNLVSGMISWVDFGYNHGGEVYGREEDFSFMWKYNFSNKIHIFTLNEINKMPIFKIISDMPTDVTAGMIIAPDFLWKKLEEMFKEAMIHLTYCGLADDDQTLLIMSYRMNPNLFEVHFIENWFLPWKNFGADHLSVKKSVWRKIEYKKYKIEYKKLLKRREYKEAVKLYCKYMKSKMKYKIEK